MAGGAFPYDLNNLLGGAVRVLYGRVNGTPPCPIPVGPVDVFGQVSPYTAKVANGWKDFGATSDAFSYARGIDVEGWEIQQASGNVIEEVTNTTRRITVPLAEITPEALQIIEEAQAVTAQASAAGTSAYDKIAHGAISSLTRYRVAFVSRRSKVSGLVTETAGGATRGRFVVGVGYQVAISADEVSIEQAKGSLSNASVTFTFFPDQTQPEGQEHGAWFFEKAGTIT